MKRMKVITSLFAVAALLGAAAMAVGLHTYSATPALVLMGGAWVLWFAATMKRGARPAGAMPTADTPHPSYLGPAITARVIDRRTAIRLLGFSALFYGPFRGIPGLLERLVIAQPTQLPPARIRQWAMIIDLRSCDGCQSVESPPRCTQACIEGHLAPEPMQWIEVFEDELEGDGTRFLPTPCQHCQNPPCVNVCPVAATFSTPEGVVLIDQDRCIGCRICMAACPYDRRFFNWGDPPVPTDALLAEYDLEAQVPARKGTVMKCDFCPDMVRAGALPYCIQACPNRAIYYGDLEEDIASNGREVVSITRFLASTDAFRLKEELGTQPRVFYIPGHGEAVGREPTRTGRMRTVWPWSRVAPGSRRWSR